MATNGPPGDHRAELLDRAYRRGYALRRRRRLTATVAALGVVAIVAGSVAALSGPSDTHKVTVVQPSTTVAPSGAVSQCSTGVDAVPAAEVPSDVAKWAGGRPVIGDKHAQLWTAVSALHVSGTLVGRTYDLKFPWYTRPNGLPQIDARRLDGSGTFHADVNLATDTRGVWDVSSLQFSAPGCWEVTGRFQSSTLKFRLRIGPVPTTVAFVNDNAGYGLDSKCNVPSDANPVCDIDVLSSNDSGRTWIRAGGIPGVEYQWRGYPDIELAASGPNVWVYGTRTFESHDGGRTFHEARFDGLASALVPEGNDVWIASRACALCPTKTLLSAPISGGAWTKLPGFPNLGDPYATLVRPEDGIAYVVGADTHAVLYRTGDGGRSWQSRALPPAPPDSSRTATVTLAALGTDQVWMLNGGVAPARNQQKTLSRSDDGGQHWIVVATTAYESHPLAYSGGVGKLPPAGLISGMTVVTPQHIWIALAQGPFIGSSDGGETWHDTGIAMHVEQVVFVDPRHGWAWNGGGYDTTDGVNWIPIAG